MGLGFNRRTVSADFIAFIRYHSMDPAGGTWSDRDRDNIPFVALADFEHIKSGWSLIEAGYPPDHHWDAVLGKPGPKPGKGYKRSLCLRLFLTPTSACASGRPMPAGSAPRLATSTLNSRSPLNARRDWYRSSNASTCKSPRPRGARSTSPYSASLPGNLGRRNSHRQGHHQRENQDLTCRRLSMMISMMRSRLSRATRPRNRISNAGASSERRGYRCATTPSSIGFASY